MIVERPPEYRKPRVRITKLGSGWPPRFALHVDGSRKPKAIGYDLERMVANLVARAERRHKKAVAGWLRREDRRREAS